MIKIIQLQLLKGVINFVLITPTLGWETGMYPNLGLTPNVVF